MKKIVFVLLMLAFVFAAGNVSLHAEGTYSIIKLEGSVNPIIADHIINSIQKANNEGAQFIVLQMDTPGGLMSTMRDIIKEILASKIPVIVYTYPRGAQAASAGAYIMLASHYAVMAPGTEIGAMHPVSPMLNFSQEKQEKGDDIMEKKVLNDT
ncbi:MAG: ATP-dependent Clp protease proteolytic subunit, partial [Spirochaetota bacterium]